MCARARITATVAQASLVAYDVGGLNLQEILFTRTTHVSCGDFFRAGKVLNSTSTSRLAVRFAEAVRKPPMRDWLMAFRSLEAANSPRMFGGSTPCRTVGAIERPHRSVAIFSNSNSSYQSSVLLNANLEALFRPPSN
jgi:hypothetical protein